MAASFDLSGLYLGVGGPSAHIVGAKQDWAQLASLSGALGKKVRVIIPACISAILCALLATTYSGGFWCCTNCDCSMLVSYTHS